MDYLTGYKESDDREKQKSFQKFINSNKTSLNSSVMAHPIAITAQNNSIDQKVPSPLHKANKSVMIMQPIPKIDNVSKIISDSRGDRSYNVWEGLYQLHANKQEKQYNTKMKSLLDQDQIYQQTCTFTPMLSRNKKNHSIGDIYERNVIWKNKIKHKIDQEIENKKIDEVKSCVFNPYLTAKYNASEEPRLRNNSVTSFYKRINDAKAVHEMKQQQSQKFTGSKWKRQTTIPVEFNLSSSPRKYALNRKVSEVPKKGISYVDEINVNDTMPLKKAQIELHRKLYSIDLS